MHVRRQIREYIAGLIDSLANVYQSRIYPVFESNEPAILVYSNAEESNEAAFSKIRTQQRLLSVSTEIHAINIENLDDQLDELAASVKAAVLTDPTLGSLVKNTRTTETEIELTGEAEQPAGVVKINFEISYKTETGKPEVSI